MKLRPNEATRLIVVPDKARRDEVLALARTIEATSNEGFAQAKAPRRDNKAHGKDAALKEFDRKARAIEAQPLPDRGQGNGVVRRKDLGLKTPILQELSGPARNVPPLPHARCGQVPKDQHPRAAYKQGRLPSLLVGFSPWLPIAA